jgi:hypothetical protein
MTIKKFNSVIGYSVGDISTIDVIDANANVTSNGLSSTGNVSFTGANVSLGAVGNLHITGGANGQVLSTDGSGNLSFQTPAAASGGNIYVFTRSSGTVNIQVSLGSITIVGRSGNISIPIQA